MRNFLLIGVFCGACLVTAAAQNILVYDENTNNQYALQGAQAIPGATVTRAGSASFIGDLAGGPWDVVAVDCPSSIPAGGWGALQTYVSAGNPVVMGYWDWDAYGGLTGAFDATVTATISSVGQTLEDMGTTPIFAGVTMPHSAGSDSWYDDGDTFRPGTGFGAAKFSAYADPVMVVGNGGSTIASFVIDEWIGSDAITLWTNMINYVPEPASVSLLALGGLALLRRR